MPAPTILVVEDDANVAQLLAFMFEWEGLAPVVLRDGRAAHAYVAAEPPPAAVVLDVMLPYRDGFSVAAAIRADPRWSGVPIVMLTARSLGADVDRGIALGVSEYVSKPFQPRALLGRVRSLIRTASAA
jgi:two-component system catabolic regulation response regulator CreB